MTDNLIHRLEAAEGPSRELDRGIHVFIGNDQPDSAHPPSISQFWFERPAYTASLDAAVSLVPEGWKWQVSTRAPAPHTGRAYLWNDELQLAGVGMARNPNYRGCEVTAATPALALCIAALKARAAQAQDEPTEDTPPRR